MNNVFHSNENIVDDNQTKSFYFPTHLNKLIIIQEHDQIL